MYKYNFGKVPRDCRKSAILLTETDSVLTNDVDYAPNWPLNVHNRTHLESFVFSMYQCTILCTLLVPYMR